MLPPFIRSLLITSLVLVVPSTLGHAAHPEELRPARKPLEATKSIQKTGQKNPSKPVAKKASVKKPTKAPSKKKSAPKSKYYKVQGKAKYSKSKRVMAAPLPGPHTPVKGTFITEVASPTDDRLEKAYIQQISSDELTLPRMPDFRTAYRGRIAGITDKDDFIQYSLNIELQEYAKLLISRVTAPHVAIVAMEPSTGRILAIADKSVSLKSAATHAGFPAASLIKVITAAAAVEKAGVHPHTDIAYRGGTYELSPSNYDPRPHSDRNSMSIAQALGKSCNPVFSRVALRFLNPALLRVQTAAFGFNTDLGLQVPIPTSRASVPNEDFEFGRTAAGFGDVFISPIHAASLMSAVANKGVLLQPSIVDQVISAHGGTRYQFTPTMIRQAVSPDTATTLMEMMTYTTTMGTSKREFSGRVPWAVPAKTGTLKGINPKGLNTWFIGAAPQQNPQIAVAVIVVNPSGSSKASHIGRLLLEKYLG